MSDHWKGIASETSRTDLLLARRGLVSTLGETTDWFASRPVRVFVGEDAARSVSGQAALLTTTTLLRRAGFPVSVSTAASHALIAGPFRSQDLIRTLRRLGASVDPSPAPSGVDSREIHIGEVTSELPKKGLRLTWDGWVAAAHTSGHRLPERDGCPLAPILAAALCVSELFHAHLGVIDAGWRDTAMSLWSPTSVDPYAEVGPRLAALPAAFLLVGLGHLGQASAWALSYLPFAWGSIEVWLADDDLASQANLSTGVLTEEQHLLDDQWAEPHRKTRFVSRSLETSGCRTRLLEARLGGTFRYDSLSPAVAIVGVDNLELRRQIVDVGWPLAIDAGLGSTPSSFDSIGIHVFDGSADSRAIPGWQAREAAAPNSQGSVFDALRQEGVDECGVVMLAGKNVAAAFVGMVAACFTIAESLRRANGGECASVLSIQLDALSTRGDRLDLKQWRTPVAAPDWTYSPIPRGNSR